MPARAVDGQKRVLGRVSDLGSQVSEFCLLPGSFFHLEEHDDASVLRLWSEDGANRLIRARVLALIDAINRLAEQSRPLIIGRKD
jgi:hypothetical protein